MTFPTDQLDLNSPLGVILRILVFVAATIIVAQVIETLLERYLRQASTRLRVSPSKYLILRRLVVTLVYITGLVVLIYSTPQLQSLSIAIFASVSIIGIIIGIAAQNTISNVIGGIAIVVFKPFRVGDFVTVRGESGFVEDITFRHTIIRLLDAHMVIPNSTITNDVLFNHSDHNIGARIDFRISYDSDLLLAKHILLNEAEKVEGVERDTIRVNVSKTDDQGVTLALVLRLEGSPFDSISALREAVILRLLNEGVILK